MGLPWDRGHSVSVARGRAGRVTDTREEIMVSDRRLVGIDLGIASAHAVRILNGEGVTLAKRKAWPTVASLTELKTVALQDTAVRTR